MLADSTRSVPLTREMKPEDATPRSTHENFDVRPGNQTGLLTFVISVRNERTSSKLTVKEKLISD